MIEIAKLKPFFPLKTFSDVEELFEYNLSSKNGTPNLTLLSIVIGLIEHSLVTINDKEDLLANSRPVYNLKDVCQRQFLHQRPFAPISAQHSYHSPKSIYQHRHKDIDTPDRTGSPAESNSGDSESRQTSSPAPDENLEIPEVEYEIVETFYKKFVDQIKNSIDLKDPNLQKPNLRIKKISDIIWFNLSNSYYKDKAHLQSVFSYLTTSKLDCFGLAFAVIAGCQILNLKNTYLALSEDHAWVMFELPQEELNKKLNNDKLNNGQPIPSCATHGTCEVTWHGKANSDKRGQSVTYQNCWLYTNGYAVKCDLRLCVAALISSINPSINSNTDSEILAFLQQRLLWLLFKHDNYFPMSLGNLGELEDICPTANSPLTAFELFQLGIDLSKKRYNDSHVYPYTYLAGYFYRHGRFKEALMTWADASLVMTNYNYSRDDEEIYKEFDEIANKLIPSMLEVVSAGGLEPGQMSKTPFLQDPECLALILKFYDNICRWEEGSSTPVLHFGWAKCFVATILKFSPNVRSKLKLLTSEEWHQNCAYSNNSKSLDEGSLKCKSIKTTVDAEPFKLESHTSMSNICQKAIKVSSDPEKALDLTCSLAKKATKNRDDIPNSKISHIADACTERILNPSFLLGTGDDSPFTESELGCDSSDSNGNGTNEYKQIKKELALAQKLDNARAKKSDRSGKRRKTPKTDAEIEKRVEEKPECNVTQPQAGIVEPQSKTDRNPPNRFELDDDCNVIVVLISHKMVGARDLLLAERLNTFTIELQLTAQSDLGVGRGRFSAPGTTKGSSATSSTSSASTTRASKRLRR